MKFRKHLKRLFSILFFLSVTISAQVSPQFLNPIDKLNSKIDEINSDSVRSVSLSFVGDLMCHTTQFRYAQIDSNKFDFSPVFEPVKKYLSASDFTFGNLETVTAGKDSGYAGYPKFNTPDEYVAALKYAGFDVLFTANNHALDMGEAGIKRTIEVIRKNGMLNVGSHKKGEQNFIILKKNGIRIAVLAYAYGTNGFILPDSSKYAVNVISRKRIRTDLQKAQAKKPDLIIVYFHYGTEYFRDADDFQKDYSSYALRYGADIVVGSHPHVVQPIVNANSKRIGKSFIAYSLGNFVSNQRWRYSDGGVILNFTVEKNILKSKIRVEKENYLPIWVYKGAVDSTGKQGYRIFAITDTTSAKPLPFFTEEDLRNMNQSFLDTKKIIEKYENEFTLYKEEEK